MKPLFDELKELWEEGAVEYDAPVGKNACKLVNHVGVQVRSILPSYNVKNWKNVDVATRDVVLQNIAVNLH